jgi:hypothetical protein
VRLALLVAGTTLPLIIFAAGIVYHDYEQDRRDASQRVLETVRSIRLVLDAEVLRMTGGLQVLALTSALRSGDFEGFRRMASGFLDQYVVFLGHDRHRKPAVAQQPRNRGAGVCDQSSAIFKSLRRRGEETADRDGGSAGHWQR